MEMSNFAIVPFFHVTPITPNLTEEMAFAMVVTVIRSVRLLVIAALTMIFGKGLNHRTNSKLRQNLRFSPTSRAPDYNKKRIFFFVHQKLKT